MACVGLGTEGGRESRAGEGGLIVAIVCAAPEARLIPMRCARRSLLRASCDEERARAPSGALQFTTTVQGN